MALWNRRKKKRNGLRFEDLLKELESGYEDRGDFGLEEGDEIKQERQTLVSSTAVNLLDIKGM